MIKPLAIRLTSLSRHGGPGGEGGACVKRVQRSEPRGAGALVPGGSGGRTCCCRRPARRCRPPAPPAPPRPRAHLLQFREQKKHNGLLLVAASRGYAADVSSEQFLLCSLRQGIHEPCHCNCRQLGSPSALPLLCAPKPHLLLTLSCRPRLWWSGAPLWTARTSRGGARCTLQRRGGALRWLDSSGAAALRWTQRRQVGAGRVLVGAGGCWVRDGGCLGHGLHTSGKDRSVAWLGVGRPDTQGWVAL